MSSHRSQSHSGQVTLPLYHTSTETPAGPIHLLDRTGTSKALCGQKRPGRAWSYAAWPAPDTTWSGQICARCWDIAWAPAVRPAREVA
jgi:hypothetical protein